MAIISALCLRKSLFDAKALANAVARGILGVQHLARVSFHACNLLHVDPKRDSLPSLTSEEYRR